MNTRTPMPALPLLLALLLGACASSGPTFNTGGVDPMLTPQGVAAGPQAATGRRVQWGGSIMGIENLPDRTRIEVLGYPLDDRGRPQVNSNPQGRFILERAGYLEPATYSKGRMISTVGTITGTRTVKVGEANTEQPVVDASQIYLWPAERYVPGAGVNFGIGFGSWGSGSGWGTGIGIGF